MRGEPGGILEHVFEGALSEADVATLAAGLKHGEPALAERAAEQLHRASLLVQVVNTVTGSLSLDELLPRLIELITEVLGAERATLFLHDRDTDELFSRVARGDGIAEIRVPPSAGIAGSVFLSGQAEIVEDAYADPRFNQEIDRRTGYRTRSILCVPLRNRSDTVIGVTQVLNKRRGGFTVADRSLLETVTAQAAEALEHAQLFERLERARREEAEMLEISEAISSDLQIDTLLGKIVTATTKLLDAERSTLFIHDPVTNELWSRVAEGADAKEIRIPANAGIAGSAFSSRAILSIPDAYADPRFNQDVDRRTGYRTRNILCLPVEDRNAKPIGVIQVLNKRGGQFSVVDIKRLKAFSAQMAIAIQNAQLFADVLELKNYNESILKSLSNGVITLDGDLRIIKVNDAARRILQLPEDGDPKGLATDFFEAENPFVVKTLSQVVATGKAEYRADVDLKLASGHSASVNFTVAPLFDLQSKAIGYMLVLEDITREKRVRGTMSRYMAKEVVEKLLESGEEMMHGSAQIATVLFSDIRSFTSLAEAMSARETVTMLNEYFTEMVEVIFAEGGILDKYIGDAIMAVFGAPLTSPHDADNAVNVANEMLSALYRLNARRAEQRLNAIRIGIGIATGEVLAGSIGSEKRMDYTVIGDSVNLASRLEGANKYYGTAILLAGETVEATTIKGLVREIDLIRVKGKAKPTSIFESLDYHTEQTFPHALRVLDIFSDGLKRYRQRDWQSAQDRFASALQLAPQDGPSKVYLDRCRYYREHEPSDNWDGVWVMHDK
jgi:adenylate cyclase